MKEILCASPGLGEVPFQPTALPAAIGMDGAAELKDTGLVMVPGREVAPAERDICGPVESFAVQVRP